MANKIFLFFALLYSWGCFLVANGEMYTSAQWGRISVWSYLTNVRNATTTSQTFGILQVPMPNADYWSTWWNVMLLHFSFFDGAGYSTIYQVVILPIAAFGIFCLIYALISVIQFVFSLF